MLYNLQLINQETQRLNIAVFSLGPHNTVIFIHQFTVHHIEETCARLDIQANVIY